MFYVLAYLRCLSHLVIRESCTESFISSTGTCYSPSYACYICCLFLKISWLITVNFFLLMTTKSAMTVLLVKYWLSTSLIFTVNFILYWWVKVYKIVYMNTYTYNCIYLLIYMKIFLCIKIWCLYRNNIHNTYTNKYTHIYMKVIQKVLSFTQTKRHNSTFHIKLEQLIQISVLISM